MYKINLYDDICELEDLWIKFQNESTFTIFQSYEWINEWIKTYDSKRLNRVRIVHVADNSNNTLMIIPFVIEKRYGIKVLNIIGGDYCGILVKESLENEITENELIHIWNTAIKKTGKYDLIYVSNIPDKINEKNNILLKFLNASMMQYSSHQAKLNSDWLSYYGKIKKKIINDTHRQIKRLRDLGELSFNIATNINDGKKITFEMIKQKSKQYQKTGVKNHLESALIQNFYLNAFYSKSEFIKAHISSMSINSEIIATHWGVIDVGNRIFYYLMPSHKEGPWMKYSPGRILMINIMEWCAKNNYLLFDFTGGDEAYKYIWSNEVKKMYYYLHPKTLSGHFIYLLIKIYKKYKNVNN